MKKRVIHYFNPETDYALAVGRNPYSPPKKIAALKREMCLFPAEFAAPGDIIAIDSGLDPRVDGKEKHRKIITSKGLSVLGINELPTLIESSDPEEIEFRPWGWNHTLLHDMKEYGLPHSLLKTPEEIDALRQLSHRRTAITFQEALLKSLPGMDIPVARECFSLDEALCFLESEGDAYFKMPWSSSGRGVIHAARLSEGRIKEWITGSIRRQGSVMAERALPRLTDFATEWHCKKGKAEYNGLSVFNASDSGRYGGNIIDSQSKLWDMIALTSPLWGENIIDAQKQAIEKIIAPAYEGPLGIDMLTTRDGSIHPCVELNIRQTMGMIALKTYIKQDLVTSLKC